MHTSECQFNISRVNNSTFYCFIVQVDKFKSRDLIKFLIAVFSLLITMDNYIYSD